MSYIHRPLYSIGQLQSAIQNILFLDCHLKHCGSNIFSYVYYVNNIQNLCYFQSCFLFIFSEVVMNFLKKNCFVIHQSVTKHILMSLFKAECSERNHLISFLEKNMEISVQVIFLLWFQTYTTHKWKCQMQFENLNNFV